MLELEPKMAEEVALKEIPIDEIPLADYKKARAEGKTTVPEKVVAVEEETIDTEKPKLKGGFQKRIDRLIKQVSALEEERETLRSKVPKEEAKAAPAVQGEPKREDFQTEIEYVRAITRWEVKEELRLAREEEEKAEEAGKQKKIAATYNEKVVEAKSRYDDWEETVNQEGINIPQGVGMAILRMPNGPDVAYEIGKNTELREELLGMDPLEAIGRAWELSKEMLGAAKADEEEEDVEETQPKPEKKTAPPIRPVTGGTTRSSVALDKMSLKDYKKARAAGRNH
jgi:hypothetical protein